MTDELTVVVAPPALGFLSSVCTHYRVRQEKTITIFTPRAKSFSIVHTVHNFIGNLFKSPSSRGQICLV